MQIARWRERQNKQLSLPKLALLRYTPDEAADAGCNNVDISRCIASDLLLSTVRNVVVAVNM